jgi:amino acid transporter
MNDLDKNGTRLPTWISGLAFPFLVALGGALFLGSRHPTMETWILPWLLCTASIAVRGGALAWLAVARTSSSGGIGWELAVIGARFAASVLLFALAVVLFPETRPEIPWIWVSSFLILLALELYLFAQGDHRR